MGVVSQTAAQRLGQRNARHITPKPGLQNSTHKSQSGEDVCIGGRGHDSNLPSDYPSSTASVNKSFILDRQGADANTTISLPCRNEVLLRLRLLHTECGSPCVKQQINERCVLPSVVSTSVDLNDRNARRTICETGLNIKLARMRQKMR